VSRSVMLRVLRSGPFVLRFRVTDGRYFTISPNPQQTAAEISDFTIQLIYSQIKWEKGFYLSIMYIFIIVQNDPHPRNLRQILHRLHNPCHAGVCRIYYCGLFCTLSAFRGEIMMKSYPKLSTVRRMIANRNRARIERWFDTLPAPKDGAELRILAMVSEFTQEQDRLPLKNIIEVKLK
jgi:hypothetical protein